MKLFIDIILIIWTVLAVISVPTFLLITIMTLCSQAIILFKKQDKPLKEITISFAISIGITMFIVIAYNVSNTLLLPGGFLASLTRPLILPVSVGSFFIIKSFRFEKRLRFVLITSIGFLFPIIMFLFTPPETTLISLILLLILIVIFVLVTYLLKLPSKILASNIEQKKQLINLIVGGLLIVVGSAIILYFAYVNELRWQKENPDINLAPIQQNLAKTTG